MTNTTELDLTQPLTPEDVRVFTFEQLLKLHWTHFKRYPCMTGPEIRELERILADRVRCAKQCFDVLEWGCGGSTVYFPNLLNTKASVPWSWLSVEHNAMWAREIRERVCANVEIKLFSTGKVDPLSRRDLDMTDYIEYPQRLGKKFDVVIVDGRRRRRCLLETPSLLKPGGICLLHDAERTYYHCAFAVFKKHTMIDGMRWWLGNMDG